MNSEENTKKSFITDALEGFGKCFTVRPDMYLADEFAPTITTYQRIPLGDTEATVVKRISPDGPIDFMAYRNRKN